MGSDWFDMAVEMCGKVKTPPCDEPNFKGMRHPRNLSVSLGRSARPFSSQKEIWLNPPDPGSRVASFLVGPYSK